MTTTREQSTATATGRDARPTDGTENRLPVQVSCDKVAKGKFVCFFAANTARMGYNQNVVSVQV